MQILSKKNDALNWLFLLGVLHLVCWTLIPAFLHSNAPLDVTEAIAWGQQWQWGYDHDPFLVGWLAYATSWLFGHLVWPIYTLSQICILVTFWAIWRLALLLTLSNLQALVSVFLLEGIFYYNFATPEFNDNVLQCPLWALSISFFYSAITTQRTRDWILTGMWAGLAMMAKYYTVMLFLPMLVIILGSTQGRQSFKKLGIYAGLIVGLMIILPNFIWQYQHDFQYLSYAVSRATVVNSWKNHWYYPLLFFFNQLAVILPCFLLYFWCWRNFNQHKSYQPNFDFFFLSMVSWGPFISTLIYSALTGTHMLSMWGMPLFCLVGLWLVFFLRPPVETIQIRKLIQGTLVCFFSALIVYSGTVILPPYWVGHAKTVSFPSLQLAEKVSEFWHQHYKQPLPYIAGHRELSARVCVYDHEHPVPYFEWSSEASPWVDTQKLQREGAIFLWNTDVLGDKIPADALKAFPQLQSPVIVELKWQTRVALKPVRVGLAILPPNNKR